MSAIEMGFGALIAGAGVLLLYLGKGSGQNRFVVFGQTIELSTPALAIIILGCGIFAMPALLPLWLPSKPKDNVDNVATTTVLQGSPRPQAVANDERDVPKQSRSADRLDASRKVFRRTDTTFYTMSPGITAQITKFGHRGEVAAVEITFRNTTAHDSDFCARPDTWRIVDELNSASFGWPLLRSGGSAICDSTGWKQLKPGGVAVAFAEIRCITGEDDTWSFYSSDLSNVVRGLQFDVAH